jgi:hypothetical protein
MRGIQTEGTAGRQDARAINPSLRLAYFLATGSFFASGATFLLDAKRFASGLRVLQSAGGN